ncbi:triose-phosphate isomerase [Desulfurispira natronophila]|uniref:Triosephosphate isomerase n=1 Tax=Desulfurispira natronophila TaxID=682562 RepID=A0A7W7Y504_9BACT|nr:triose-phosphate isomerase [Desulfurispira natronophila]MBB5022208.1 triosephosphate isomerase [Desulfurispira natronophila]
MKSTIIVANWKMHHGPGQTRRYLEAFVPLMKDLPVDRQVIICPPSISLAAALEATGGTPIKVGAQNVHQQESGAYTGEISAAMLAEAGVEYAIVGHSERRQLFGETDSLVNQKALALQNCGVLPIVCVGETLEQRQSGEAQATVRQQVEAAVAGLDLQRLCIAYEPVWAIGTGQTATPEDAQEIHSVVRDVLRSFGDATAVPVLYGGSVKPDSVDELMAQPDINGALVGGASLLVESFQRICCYQSISPFGRGVE